MTAKSRAIQLTRLNVSKIFGEKSAESRLKTMSELWVPSSETFFVDSTGVFKSHEAISEMIDHFQSLDGPQDELVELGRSYFLCVDKKEQVMERGVAV